MKRKNYSYTQITKENVLQEKTTNACCRRSELTAIIHACGYLNIRDRNLSFSVVLDSSPLLRYLFILLKEIIMVTPDVMYRVEVGPTDIKYHFVVRGQSALNRLMGFLGYENGVIIGGGEGTGGQWEWPVMITKSLLNCPECCRLSYLRGAFLAAGSVNAPNDSYYLDIYTEYEQYALAITDTMKSFNIKPSLRTRVKGYYVYLSRAEAVIAFLRLVRAKQTVEEFEKHRLIKKVKEESNRLVNLESALIDRQVRASYRQIVLINNIDHTIGLNNISASLREAAELRQKHPEATMKELGEMLSPPLSKSGMLHRLNRLNQIDQSARNS